MVDDEEKWDPAKKAIVLNVAVVVVQTV